MIPNDVLLPILLSAALNAGWNSVIKIGGDKTAAIQIKFYSEHARFPTPQELDKLHKEYVKTYGGITINGKKE